jgi:hypothetical protein
MSDNNLGPREPNNDMVICPNCTCQFRAIPVNVQKELAEARVALREIEHEWLNEADSALLEVMNAVMEKYAAALKAAREAK